MLLGVNLYNLPFRRHLKEEMGGSSKVGGTDHSGGCAVFLSLLRASFITPNIFQDATL
jgi:hypothetical protein